MKLRSFESTPNIRRAVAARKMSNSRETEIIDPDRHGSPREYYESRYSDAWRREDDSAGGRFTKMWYHAFVDYVLPSLDPGPGQRVLEVGAGYGYIAPAIRNAGSEYYGVELAFAGCQQVLQMDGCHAIQADGCHLPLTDGSFDVVVCFETLEHVPDREMLMAECFRACKTGGRVVFSCPNYCNLFLPFKLLADLGVPQFVRYMVRQPIDRTMTAFGLRALMKSRGSILGQRAVRLAPPLFERFESRNAWRKLNDAIFVLEGRWGDRAPLNFLGLHTICVAAR